ncbi:FAD/NAD(P)-binding domain-containing protein [Atractiella rhizophila]|nr:FAD/NAD(P)-binding domain-containing protein [Atractiella rhizophila]
MTEIAIFGCGIIGPLTAHFLLSKFSSSPEQIHITIYEVYASLRTIGGAVNLSPNAVRLLSHVGCDPRRYGGKTPMVLFQNERGERVGEFFYSWPADGCVGMRVGRRDLMEDLVSHLPEDEGRVKISFGKRAVRMEEVEEAKVRVTFEDGEERMFDWVIGADGIHSFTRSQIHASSSDAPKAVYSGITTVYGLLPSSSIPKDLLAPLSSHRSIRTISPHAGLFSVSYSRGDDSQIHWFSSRAPPTPPSPDEAAPDGEEVRKELLEAYKDFPAPIEEVIRKTEKIYYWPVFRLSDKEHKGQWYSPNGRIVLVGDAAHALPPFAAQGVGMGAEDASLVSSILHAITTSHKPISPSSIPKIWEREYVARRVPRVDGFIKHAESQGRGRKDDGWWIGKFREWSLWLAFPLISLVNSMGYWDVQGWGYDTEKEKISVEDF